MRLKSVVDIVMGLVLAFFMLIVVGVAYRWYFRGTPDVRVYEFNSTPYAAGEAPRQILPPEKLYRTYTYCFEFGGDDLLFAPIDLDGYLEDHPKDAVLASFFNDIGWEVTIYSNELPDSDYFKFDGVVLVGEWPGTGVKRP